MKLSKRLGAYWALNLSLLPSVLAATCSQLSGSTYIGPNHNKFNILCDTYTVGGHIYAYYSQADEFQECVDRCDADSSCIAASYLDGIGDCALMNSYTSTRSLPGNDLAVKVGMEVSSSASSEATSTEATTSEATSTEATSTEASTTEATASTEVSSTVATSTETSTAETSTAETSTSEAATSQTTSSDTLTISTTSETSSISSSITSEDTASGLSSTSEPLSVSTAVSTTSQQSSSAESTSETSTSAESTTATTELLSTSASSFETSTDDCDDETSSLETSATVTTSTVTGSGIQPTTQPSEPTTSASSTITTTSSPSSLTTVTQTYTTYGQVASSSGSSSCSSTKAVGSKTLSTSGVTIVKTTSESHLPTSYPTTDSVWTVYLTLVKYVSCTTGVVAETVTTATYVTVDGNGGSYGPPVVTTPAGCIGGYQVDASGHSYPIAQPTKGSPSNSQPEQGNKQPSVPESTQESQANYPDNKNSQPSAPGQGSPEPNNSEPQPAYHTSTLVNPALLSPVHQGQQGFSTAFTAEASVTEKIQAPKSTHSLGSSEAGDAPSTPVSVSGANRHQGMALALVAGALLGLGMLF